MILLRRWEIWRKPELMIQDKPVIIIGFKNIESVTHTQVLYVNKNAGFDLDHVKSKIAGSSDNVDIGRI